MVCRPGNCRGRKRFIAWKPANALKSLFMPLSREKRPCRMPHKPRTAGRQYESMGQKPPLRLTNAARNNKRPCPLTRTCTAEIGGKYWQNYNGRPSAPAIHASRQDSLQCPTRPAPPATHNHAPRNAAPTTGAAGNHNGDIFSKSRPTPRRRPRDPGTTAAMA